MTATLKTTPLLFVECGHPHDRGIATQELNGELTPEDVLARLAAVPDPTTFSYGKKLELTVNGTKFHAVMQRTGETYAFDASRPLTPAPVPVQASQEAVTADVTRGRYFNVDYRGHHDGDVEVKQVGTLTNDIQPLDIAARVTEGNDGRFVMGFWFSHIPKTKVDGISFTAPPEVEKRYLIGDAVPYAEFMSTVENAKILAWNLKAKPDSTFIKGATGRWQLLGENDVHISFADIAKHIRETPASDVLGV